MTSHEADSPSAAEAPAAQAARSRDERSLRGALAEASPAVRRFLFGLCGDWHEAEDAAQEALLRAWRRRASFDGRADAKTWIFAIARNHWLDRLRTRRARGDMRPIDETTHLAGPGPSPPAAAAEQELAAAVGAALARLPAEQREALALRESGSLTFVQIAGVLGVPPATVKSRVRYALLKLAAEPTLQDYRPEASP